MSKTTDTINYSQLLFQNNFVINIYEIYILVLKIFSGKTSK